MVPSEQIREYTAPISQEEWRGLKSGDGILDAYGRMWVVLKRDPNGNPDRLFAKIQGCHDEDRLDWVKGQILDEEWAIIMELNDPSVRIARD